MATTRHRVVCRNAIAARTLYQAEGKGFARSENRKLLQRPDLDRISTVSGAPSATGCHRLLRYLRHHFVRNLCALALRGAGQLFPLTALPVLASVMTQRRPASYSRFSSDHQNARSITDQQRKCRDRAQTDRLTICPALEFFDEAMSGANPDRAGFDKMLAAARAGLISDLYVESLSRLARDCVLTMQILRELVYVHKIRIVSMHEGIDSSLSDNWELLAAIFGIQHEQFLRLLAENVFRRKRASCSTC